MPVFLFPDTTVLINFAVVDRLGLLRAYLDDRGRTVEAVAFEVGRSAQRTPHLADLDVADWFGTPIRIDRKSDTEEVSRIRVGRFGGSPSQPLQHLGESQTLHVISRFPDYRGSWMITDDRDAYELSKAQGIATKHTIDVLEIS